MLDLHMYVDVILFVMCKENHTICNVYINLTQPMLVPVLPVVCWREHVLFTLIVCVCVCIVVSYIHCVVF